MYVEEEVEIIELRRDTMACWHTKDPTVSEEVDTLACNDANPSDGVHLLYQNFLAPSGTTSWLFH